MKLQKFNPTTIKHPSNILIIGKCSTGKTTLVLDLLHHLNIKNGFVATEFKSEEYRKFYPNLPINSKDEFKNIINSRGISFNVIDSCGYLLSEARKSKLINKIIIYNQKFDITNIIANCYLTGIRIQWDVDYLFLLKENIIDNNKKAWKNFGSMFKEFKDFQVKLTEYTSDYGCMVLDIKEQKAYWYKAIN